MLMLGRARGQLCKLAGRRASSSPAYIQDGPPPGGYPEVKYKKNIPPKGPSNLVLIGSVSAVVAYGWYFTIQNIYARNRLKVEQTDIRMTILPYLQAEEDQRYLEVKALSDAKERELMADVPGWEVGKSTFDTVDWVRPKSLPWQ
mmetsp:Transcript_5810/g.14882  ORF Transcript_5810/g.14882 Transcript_5810/m.14882 type:complete len:145 (-) Transcript_5810:219-653(-)|eukprot:CAMPEP_0119414382 /NCGR_PEP_ID=MMETSP1335-20130426/6887_1 /TAXON_ID=259385 /ORGANISM="Chrysoculter rhomboideus, Strain RCC1486" /LENGTH=144 /DNA_ID=CAMNT_0007439261 /DNA_START=70 /DNA_END=504 /DNA_ORIENTATION=+